MAAPTRREFMSLAGGGAVWSTFGWSVAGRQPAQAEIAQRIAAVVREYEAQGFHRTATAVDRQSGEWLAEHVRRAGARAALESFPVNRVDPVTARVAIAGKTIEALPLFDAAFTSAQGVRGALGLPGATADIGLFETAVNQAGAGALGDARRSGRYRALVAITRGQRPGLCPSNADEFLEPYGPPVLQVSSEEAGWLNAQARAGGDAHLVAHVERTATETTNVTAELRGTEAGLAPVVVMTPRSGWYTCASERAGGIACWLEIMRGLAASPARRPVVFVASSGHELGHLGIDAFIARRESLVKSAAAWLHLGANIGAATDLANNLVQASDDEMESRLTGAMKAVDLAVARRAPRGRVPAGEAEAVHRGGGRYASAIGGNALFHNIADRGPGATDAPSIATFAAAFTAVVRSI